MFIKETHAIIITDLFLQLHARAFRSYGVQVTHSSSEDACRANRQIFSNISYHNQLVVEAHVSFPSNLAIPYTTRCNREDADRNCCLLEEYVLVEHFLLP